VIQTVRKGIVGIEERLFDDERTEAIRGMLAIGLGVSSPLIAISAISRATISRRP